MPENRDVSGKFVVGSSGNPGGRPRTRPFKEALQEEIELSGDSPCELREVARQLIEKAKGGDIQAMNALFDRLDGKPVTTVKLMLEKQLSELSPEEAINAITNQVVSGEISPQEGQQLTTLIEARIKAVEFVEIEERIAKLEANS